MIRVYLTTHDGEDFFAARFVCDYCKKPIEDAEMGLSVTSEEPTKKTPAEVAHVHKGNCDRKHEAALEGKGKEVYGTDELTTHVAQLALNAGMKVPIATLKKWAPAAGLY